MRFSSDKILPLTGGLWVVVIDLLEHVIRHLFCLTVFNEVPLNKRNTFLENALIVLLQQTKFVVLMVTQQWTHAWHPNGSSAFDMAMRVWKRGFDVVKHNTRANIQMGSTEIGI